MVRTIQDNQRDSMEEKEIHVSMKNNKEKITRKEMKYWLEDNYTNWLPDVLREMINENKPNALINLKKEIKKAFNKLPSKRIKELELINQSHKDLNGNLRTELKEHKEEERIRQDNKKEWERITKL